MPSLKTIVASTFEKPAHEEDEPIQKINGVQVISSDQVAELGATKAEV
jgi:hypothetical protein